MICRKSLVKNSRAAGSAVHLNVYDLTSINGYAYWLGLGVYHSGVQVHGVEYAFGAHEYPTTGIFEGEPKQCDGFTFRKSILIGFTDKTPRQVRGLMEELAEKYRGNKYNLITKNCNHFCNDACIKLTGNPIPNWINRLARLGFLCQCMIPVNLNSTRARHRRVEDKGIDVEKKKLTSQSNRFTNSCSNSSSSSSSSTPPVPSNGAESRRRSSLPLVLDSNTN